MTLNYLMIRLLFWSFKECGVHIYCHHSHIHSDGKATILEFGEYGGFPSLSLLSVVQSAGVVKYVDSNSAER